MNRLLVVSLIAVALVSSATAADETAPRTPGPSESARQRDADAAKISPAKEAAIRRLLELAGIKNVAQRVMNDMATGMKPLLVSSLPAGAYREKLINLFYEKFMA